MIEEGFSNNICFGCQLLKWPQAASYLVFWYRGVTFGTLAPPSGQSKKHRRVLKGSGDRECCQEQYLFWLLVSKMALGCHRQECPYLDTLNPLRNWQTVNPFRVKTAISCAHKVAFSKWFKITSYGLLDMSRHVS